MFYLLVTVASVVLSIGFWLDSEIQHGVLRFWWIPIIACYLILCLRFPVVRLTDRWKLTFVGITGGLIFAITLAFDDTLTIYLAGVVLLFGMVTAEYFIGGARVDCEKTSRRLVLVGLVAIALLILPLSINRVVVMLPNLSGGTTLTLSASTSERPGANAVFSNLSNDHQEVTVELGTQIYFQQPHEAPLIRIDILQEDVVVRVISISYESRVAYLSLPLFKLQGAELQQLVMGEAGGPFTMQMDHDQLLIGQLKTSAPAWIQLPHMDNHNVTGRQRALAMLVRVLIWLIICFALIQWLPRNKNLRDNYV